MKPLYSYGGIFVTGEHCVYENNEFKMVKHCKNASLTNVITDYYYCIQTTKKYVMINNIKFGDWDDIDENDKLQLKKRYYLITDEELNNKFNSGIREDTQLELKNGNLIKIKNIKLGDILKDSNVVVGKVKVSSPKKVTQYINKDGNSYFGYNLYLKNLGNDVKKVDSINLDYRKKYYHLITMKKSIMIENEEVGDFNWIYDTILDKHNELFLN